MATIVKRIGKNGVPSYRVQIRHQSRHLKALGQNQTIGKTFPTLDEAERWAEQTERGLKGITAFGPDLIRIPQSDILFAMTGVNLNKSSILFGDVIERYKDQIQIHKALNTRLTQRNQIEHWKQRLGKTPLDRITTANIVKEKDLLFAQGKKSSTVRRYMVILSHIFATATNQWELIDKNPMKKVIFPKDSKGRTRFLSTKEIKILLEKCKACPHYQVYPVTLLALSSGARYSEVINLPLRQLDFDRKMMILKDTKNGEDRGIPLPDSVIDAMKKYVKELAKRHPTLDPDTCLLFPSKNRTTPAYIRKRFRMIVRECGFKDYVFHSNRHTFSSHAIMTGMSLLDLSHQLGHRTLAQVKTYAHLSDPHTRMMVEKTNENMFRGIDL